MVESGTDLCPCFCRQQQPSSPSTAPWSILDRGLEVRFLEGIVVGREGLVGTECGLHVPDGAGECTLEASQLRSFSTGHWQIIPCETRSLELLDTPTEKVF